MTNTLINSLKMEGFKCFEALNLELGQLTVLSGYNGAGKSTALQSILLFSQALRKNGSAEVNSIPAQKIAVDYSIWPLNGDLVRLGTCGDVMSTMGNNIIFEYNFLDHSKSTSFELVAERGERNLKCLLVADSLTSEQIKKIASQIQFISAERGGLNDIYPIPDDPVYSNVGVGTDGRFASYWFDNFSDSEIEQERSISEIQSNTFRDQVNAWLDFVSPGTSVNVKKFENASVLALQFQLSELGEWRSPANVGFGISYVFPLIVALLSASKGDCIIIDSPEAHLHPRAQSKVGIMISKLAHAGVQVILETHSDHILNGVRIAVKKGYLNPVDLSLLFFSGVSENESGVVSTEIDKNGNIEYWPPGFFDQMDSDIVELLSDD